MKLFMKYVFAILLVLPLLTLSGNAQQNITMKKYVIGGGGILHQVNNQGISISGMLGQPVIEKRLPTSLVGDGNYTLHQGFWVPPAYYMVGVDDSPITPNNGLTNYPNPFNQTTTIKYELKAPAYVVVKVYDVVGNEIATVFEGYQNAQMQEVPFDAKDKSGLPLASGSYLYEVNVKPADMAGNSAFQAYVMRNIMIVIK